MHYDPEPYRLLALAVLQRAWEDAFAVRGDSLWNRRNAFDDRSARAFFTGGGEGFQFWCALAGVDADKLRKRFLWKFTRRRLRQEAA